MVGVTKKDVSYKQADPLNRWTYQWFLGHLDNQYDKDHILYMDEAGISATDCYQWGWFKKGTMCDIPRLGGRGQRRNFISAIRASDKDWVEPWVIKGTINRAVFTQWLTALGESLLLGSFNQEPYLLICDNASFHSGGDIEIIALKYNIRILYLPAYSPDLNPIENCWAILKHYIRLALGEGLSLDDSIDEPFNRSVAT